MQKNFYYIISQIFFYFVTGVHADGQYQADTFQTALLDEIGTHDPYFLLPWDVANWIDRVMEKLREKNDDASPFFKRLIKRSNKLNTMFGHGKGHLEYVGLGKRLGKKSLEIGSFATTRFFSSAYEQWERIIESYPALIDAYISFREQTADECDETKYEVIFFN